MPIAVNFQSSAPLDVVDFYFNKHCTELGKPSKDLIQFLEKQFESDYVGSSAYFRIPSINSQSIETLKPKSLVRFCCMIQDMREPELIPSRIRVRPKAKNDTPIKNVLFRDYIDEQYELDKCSDDFMDYITRCVFNCVSVPAETDWIMHKRLKAEEDSAFNNQPVYNMNSGIKRKNEDQDERGDLDASGNPIAKRQDCSGLEEKLVKRENLPFMRSCIVKLYRDDDSFKLNDIVEFIGILTSGFDESMESPSSKAMCMHAVYARPIFSLHPDLYNVKVAKEAMLESNLPYFNDVRAKLISYLASSLQGDHLAAEYLLCHLLSASIHKDVGCLGKFSFNLFDLPSDSNSFVLNLKEKLTRILTKLHYLPMTLDVLNGESFVPKKDYEKNLLRTGRLQLSQGTELIIDEAKLSIGQLNEQGVKNIATLKSLILNQKLDYDFHYYGIEFRTDFNVLVLSEGPSCLPSDCSLSLHQQNETNNTLQNFDENDIEQFRLYLILARSTDLKVDQAMEEKIREDFVEMRRNNSSITQEKLHNLLLLSRWLTCSFGISQLSSEIWEKAKAMDEERTKRLSQN